MSLKPYYEMKPDEIIRARELSGCVFIPVSPIEWHGPHLPMGTDALISESICRLVAEKINGVYFNALFLGTDAFRSEEELLNLGFNKKDKVFGMNFPCLPLVSEYCDKEKMKSCVKGRLEFVKESKFRTAFVVNHHNGLGQSESLKEVCDYFNSEDFNCEYVYSYRFYSLEENCLKIEIGGHAGLSETNWLLAFRPELVDLSKIPNGELNVRDKGLYHYQPIIEEKYNPRYASKAIADDLRNNIVNNFIKYINDKYLNF